MLMAPCMRDSWQSYLISKEWERGKGVYMMALVVFHMCRSIHNPPGSSECALVWSIILQPSLYAISLQSSYPVPQLQRCPNRCMYIGTWSQSLCGWGASMGPFASTINPTCHESQPSDSQYTAHLSSWAWLIRGACAGPA